LGNFRIRFLFDPIWNFFEIPVEVTLRHRAGEHVRALFLCGCHAGISWTGGFSRLVNFWAVEMLANWSMVIGSLTFWILLVQFVNAWLVVWNIFIHFLFFHILGIIVPTD